MADLDGISVAVEGSQLTATKRTEIVASCQAIPIATAEQLQQLALVTAEFPDARDILRETNGIDNLVKLVDSTDSTIGEYIAYQNSVGLHDLFVLCSPACRCAPRALSGQH